MIDTCDIFIISCDRDAEWLAYCLRSIDKFARGFRHVIVALPDYHAAAIKVAVSAGVKIKTFVEHHQKFAQVQTLMHTCHKWGCDGDYVLQVDSDCHFRKPTYPEDFFMGGKPIVQIHSYDLLDPRDSGQWRPASEQTLGFSTPYETMGAPGRMFPVWLFKEVEDYIVERHGKPIDEYVCSRPWGLIGGRNDYAEFNVIGAYALKFYPELFHWHDSGQVGRRADWPITQKWSYAGVEASRAELERILGTENPNQTQ